MDGSAGGFCTADGAVADDILEGSIVTAAFFARDEDDPLVAGVLLNEETPTDALDETTGLFEILDDFPSIAFHQPRVKSDVILIL